MKNRQFDGNNSRFPLSTAHEEEAHSLQCFVPDFLSSFLVSQIQNDDKIKEEN